MEITGKIIDVLPLQSGISKAGSNWQLQTYILETQEQYPKKVAIELFNRTAEQYKCAKDEIVTVSFDIESREFNGRWYTSVRAWRIDHNAAAAPAGTMPPMAPTTQPVAQPVAQPTTQMQSNTQPFTSEPDESSDMPF